MKLYSQEWRETALEQLMRGGPACQRAAQYILTHHTPIGVSRQSTGARWTLKGAVEVNEGYFSLDADPTDRQLLAYIAHEVAHLEQGLALALSVEGEVGGWKAEYAVRAELGAPITDPHWQAVAATPDPPTKEDLRRARAEMLAMAGYGYLIWLLPLRPNLLMRLAESILRRVVPGFWNGIDQGCSR